MSSVSHQTIRLSRGRHASPEEGACVMELASMLAGEPFSDHPRSVCPVIGSFLRAYNDSVNARRRQDLYPYAALVVGTRASVDVRRARAERLREWRGEMYGRGAGSLGRRSLAWIMGHLLSPVPEIENVGSIAVAAIRRHTDETHAAALRLVEELVGIGRDPAVSLLGGWAREVREPPLRV